MQAEPQEIDQSADLGSRKPARTGQTATWLRGTVLGDRVTHLVVLGCGLAVIGLTVLMAWQLLRASAPSRHQFGWHFLWSQIWDPVAQDFGAAAFLYGTVVTSVIALVLAVPLGLGTAVFLAELAPPRLSHLASSVIDLLAAIPSVLYGLIGVAIVVPIMRSTVEPGLRSVLGWLPLFSGPAYGVGYLTAGVVLALMVVPFIVAVVREVLLAVPREQREAALALGSTRWESTWHVVIPHARLGIYGAVFLALGRALGETMAVTMVIGNRAEISGSLFAPGYTMAAVIANEFTEATGDVYLSALIEVGLVLFALTMLVNGAARLLIAMTTRTEAAL